MSLETEIANLVQTNQRLVDEIRSIKGREYKVAEITRIDTDVTKIYDAQITIRSIGRPIMIGIQDGNMRFTTLTSRRLRLTVRQAIATLNIRTIATYDIQFSAASTQPTLNIEFYRVVDFNAPMNEDITYRFQLEVPDASGTIIEAPEKNKLYAIVL